MSRVIIRPAEERDIDAIIALFADDSLGGHGDTVDPAARPAYRAAFEKISQSPTDMLYVAELDGQVAGTFQTTLITTMSGRGGCSLTISAVQTRADLRGRGIGSAMMRFAVARAREAGADKAQLVSSKRRVDAHRFYERAGFVSSHVGFQMKLE